MITNYNTWNDLAEEYFSIKDKLKENPFKPIDYEKDKQLLFSRSSEFGNIMSWFDGLDFKNNNLAFKITNGQFYEWYLKEKIAKRYSKKQVTNFINAFIPHKDSCYGFNKKPSIIQDLVVLHLNKIIDIYDERMKAAIQYCPQVSPIEDE